MEETRVAVLSIIVEDKDSVAGVNDLLFEFRDYVIGRFGLPYKARDINIICIVLDASQDVISALSGKLGSLSGITCKATYSSI